MLIRGGLYIDTLADIAFMDDYVIVFNNMLDEYGLTKAQVTRWSGLSHNMIMRFTAGGNISTTYFFSLIRSMPIDFQEDFWNRILSPDIKVDSKQMHWPSLIANASYSDVQDILMALAHRWRILVDERNIDESNIEAS